MTLVRLIVTGVSEQLGMASFLAKIFPETEFETEKTESFTSCRVEPFKAVGTTAIPVIDKLANAVIASIDPGRKKTDGPVPDFVLAIDDLELFNLDQPKVVVDEFSAAIQRRIPIIFPSAARQNRCLQRLKDHASFHLLSPMVEAYFFADPNAILKSTGNSIFQLVPGKDLEDFETCDAGYLQKHSNLPKNVPLVPIKPKTQEWFAKHPKEYVRHLSADPQTGLVAYREANQGVAALKDLSPIQALSVATQRQFLRSIVHDLAYALNQPVPTAYQGNCHPETSRYAQGNRVLRNI